MDNNNKTFNILLKEEIDRVVDKFSLKRKYNGKNSLNELFSMNISNFMKDIGSQEISADTEIDTELWEWFLHTIDQSMQETTDAWKELLKEQKLKILCYKFFTKKELIEKEKLQEDVRKKIGKFFTALQNYTDLNGFREKISNLPSELLSNLIRYMFSYSDTLSEGIKISKKELSAQIKDLYKERMDMIEKVDLISKGYQTVLDFTKIKKLYDNGLFFEDNIVNRGVNEYIVKLLNHKSAAQNLKDNFSNTLIADLKDQACTNTAYISHIESIKQEEAQEFFTSKGYQIGSRFSNEIEAAKDKNSEGQVIDKNSVFKEPKSYISNVVSPWEKESSYGPGEMGSTDGDAGGGDSFGGNGTASDDMSGNNFDSPIDLQSDQGESLPDDNTGEDGETPLPSDENGFPEDFGSEETNPTNDDEPNDKETKK